MKIYNTALKLASRENLGTRSLARFIHIMLRENVLNSQQKGNILEFLAAA